MTRRQSTLTLACIYIGTVIGAGFASGQEILQFFGKHGLFGIAGVFIATILFCRLGSNLLQMVHNKRINSFEDFLKIYFNYKSSSWINLVMTVFLLIGYIVMLAGGGAILKEIFAIDSIYGILIMSVLCYITFIFGVKGIAKANNVIVPLLMFIIIIFTIIVLSKNTFILKSFIENPIGEFKQSVESFNKLLEGKELFAKIYLVAGWLWSSILYVSFNSLVAVVVLSTLLPFIKDNNTARLGGIVGGLGLGFMAVLILINLLFYYTSVYKLEVPMIAVANNLGKTHKEIYSLLLWFAMFTTAIANGYGCIKNIANINKVSEVWVRFIVCSSSIPFAMVGFKKLISFFYPLMGYVGILFLLLILFGSKKVKGN